jgi:hypothetical protein
MGTTRLARFGAIGGALLVTACGNQTIHSQTAAAEPMPDPKYLVVELSDLPRGFAPVPGESLRVPLAWVLRDPWNAGFRPLIRRERVAGYERSFWNPEHHRIECEAAVYRSTAGAARVFRLRNSRFEPFAIQLAGRSIRIQRIGQAAVAFHLNERWRGFIVVWRYRNVLARCAAASLGEALPLAHLQQRRIARTLG